MKKKVALTAAAVALVGTLAVGGTLAWFTDTETATNVVTTGHVDISVMEKDSAAGTYEEKNDSGLTLDGKYVPNATVDKFVTVKNNNNSSKAWIRVKIEMPDSMNDAVLKGMDEKWIKNTADSSDEYYYYTDAVDANQSTEELITGIQLPNWGNDMTDQGTLNTETNKIDNGINIEVIAEAVQADNIADTCVDAFKKATENGQTISKYTN